MIHTISPVPVTNDTAPVTISMNPFFISFRLVIVFLATCLLAVAPQLFAAAAPPSPRTLVVVKLNGQVQTIYLQPGALRPAADTCSNSTTAFAFTVNAAGGAQQTITVGTPLPVTLNAQVSCSNIAGEAEVLVGTRDGSAHAPGDYNGPQMEALVFPSLTTGDGNSHSASASLQLEAYASGAGSSFSIGIEGGSYYAERFGNQTNVAGTLGAASSPIVTVSIGASTLPEEVVDTIPDLPLDGQTAVEVTSAATQSCASGNIAGDPVCTALGNAASAYADSGDPVAEQVLKDNVMALAPDELTGIARTAESLAASQQANIASRMIAMRMGGNDQGGVSFAGLSALGRNGELPIGALLEAALVEGFAPLRADEDEEARRTLLGGTRWGAWVNGTVGRGDYGQAGSEAAFDFDNWSLTAGIDYRFPWNGYAGIGFGRSRTDMDFADESGDMGAAINAAHLYGGYDLDSGLSLDASASYQWGEYEQLRRQTFYGYANSTANVIGNYSATSSSDVRQHSWSLGASWYLRRNAFLFAPRIQFQYSDTSIDGFVEEGDSPFLLRVEDQSLHNRSWSAGFYADYALATSFGSWRFNLRGTYVLDGSTGTRDLLASFVNGGGTPSTSFAVPIHEPDRRYAIVEPGIAFSRPFGTRTWDFNVGVMKLLRFDSLDRWAVRFDVRVPL